MRLRFFFHRSMLAVLAILTFFPFVFLFITSFKSLPQFYRHFWIPAFPLHLKNYVDAWDEIANYLSNSIMVSGTTLVAVLALASVAGSTNATATAMAHARSSTFLNPRNLRIPFSS